MRAELTTLAVLLAALPAAAQSPRQGPAEAVLVSMQSGDAACQLVLRDAEGREAGWPASFDLCDDSRLRTGRRYAFTWKAENILHPSCQGDVNCRRSLRVMLAVEARPVAR
jgi:hypothetical protein